MVGRIRYLVEVRSNASSWREDFLRELSWELADGVISLSLPRWRDELGLYSFFEVEEVLATLPVLAADAPVCPFVGPRRGFFGWLMVDRAPDARRFGVDAARVGRGVVVDLGPPGDRRPTPICLPSVVFASWPVSTERLWFLPDASQVLKHSSDILLSNDETYLAHVRAAMYRCPGAPRPGRTGPPSKVSGTCSIEIWRYELRSEPSYWFE